LVNSYYSTLSDVDISAILNSHNYGKNILNKQYYVSSDQMPLNEFSQPALTHQPLRNNGLFCKSMTNTSPNVSSRVKDLRQCFKPTSHCLCWHTINTFSFIPNTVRRTGVSKTLHNTPVMHKLWKASLVSWVWWKLSICLKLFFVSHWADTVSVNL